MIVRPGDDLGNRKIGKVLPVPHAATSLKKPGQRGPASKPAASIAERRIHVGPDFSSGAVDRAGIGSRPGAVHAEMLRRPDRDLSFGQRWQLLHVPHVAVFVKELGQRRATGQPT
jgi:hypothetical protein